MIRLITLGRLDLDGVPNRSAQEILRQPKRFGLLIHLALAASDGRYVRRDSLLPLFWPSSDERRARRALNQALCFLRQRLGQDAIVSRGNDEVGVAGEAVWCDARAFREAIKAGKLEDGLRLYCGDFLPGFHVDDVVQFEHWGDEIRRELRALATDAAIRLAERAAQAGDGAAVLGSLTSACRVAPYDEATLRQALTLLAGCGQQRPAAELLAGYRRRLADDLELEPSAKLLDLARSLDVPVLDDIESPPVLAEPEPGPAPESAAAEPPAPPLISEPPATGPDATRDRPRSRAIWRVLQYGLPTAALLVLALTLGRSEGRLTASPVPGPLAVALGDVTSADASLSDLSLALTGALGTRLADIEAIRIVRREEARPGRVPPARLVVEGSLMRVGEHLRADFHILDASTRALLDVVSVEAPLGDGTAPAAALDELGHEAAARLREHIGGISERLGFEREVPDPLHRRAIDDALLVMAEADSLRARGSHDAADQALDRADVALAEAARTGRESAEIWLLRARIAGKRGWLALRTDPAASIRLAHWRAGIEHATRAIAIDPNAARALEQRGLLRYWTQILAPGPGSRAASDAIERDLARAVEIDPTLAEAWAVLSVLATRRSDFADARLDALRAYRADAYLESVSEVLSQLILTSIEVDDIPGATRWCDELNRRRPENWVSARCRLLLLSFTPMPSADLHRRIATILAGLPDTATWAAVRPQLIGYAAVALARAGAAADAERLFATVGEPRNGDLGWLEPAFLDAIGRDVEAVASLRRYVENDPDRRRWMLDSRFFESLAYQHSLESF